MTKIIDKIRQYEIDRPMDSFFSFEYFPPKTEAGVENLYLRMERMTALQPMFIDVTWGAAASTKGLTMAICEYAQKYFGVQVLMHLTCTGQSREQIKQILYQAKEMGIRNILALRGDPPKGALTWTSHKNGFDYAAELVRFIRQEFGDYFCIAVAGFPEGYPQATTTLTQQIEYLKEKVNAGADFILTQFFYDPLVFLSYVEKCRQVGITCPIIPGMMPIQNYSSFQRMTSYCRTTVPQHIWNAIQPISENDEAVKDYGVQLCISMCQELFSKGIKGFHFYTLNLENSVLNVLKALHVDDTTAARRNLPWRGSRSNLKGMTEDVRPINWANRPKSYIARTNEWDEYPNGRWGDGRSPAFGELSTHFFGTTVCTKEDRLTMWGESPLVPEEIGEVFVKYIEGKIPILPWCETALQLETNAIAPLLLDINRRGFWTINSQPSVNGLKSDHSVFGWGGPGGRVYQKSYVEFFTSPSNLQLIINALPHFPSLTLHCIDCQGNVNSFPTTSTGSRKGVVALTWGVFPDKEILQPTIFDPNTFVVWSQEAFQLWIEAWAVLYEDETESSALIHQIHDTYLLVAIIDNDFIDSDMYAIFRQVIQHLENENKKPLSPNDDHLIELDEASGLVL